MYFWGNRPRGRTDQRGAKGPDRYRSTPPTFLPLPQPPTPPVTALIFLIQIRMLYIFLSVCYRFHGGQDSPLRGEDIVVEQVSSHRLYFNIMSRFFPRSSSLAFSTFNIKIFFPPVNRSRKHFIRLINNNNG